jgi:adenosine deaminase
MQETDAPGLLRLMASRNVLVEIALTSNEAILGIHGAAHPLATYLRYGVPVALVTDDEGVSRSDMTHEYLRAVTDQGIDYATLRTMARNSLFYSFVQPATKGRLLREFDAATAKFEERWAKGAR